MFRHYSTTKNAIQENYKDARTNQTEEYVKEMYQNYHNRNKYKMNIWDVIKKLDYFVDISDPDISMPNSYHAFQAAETARKNDEPEWFQVICLLHDLGKIMHLWGRKRHGMTNLKQWGLVGDTFIVGCPIPNTIVYPEFNLLNPDHVTFSTTNNKYGIYTQHCGLDKCLISWGHDEYLYKVIINQINHNPDFKHSLPEEALYIIRYHSLYLWHDKEEYQHLVNQKDRDNLPWLKKFNKYDLYTKENKKINYQELKEYYDLLLKSFFSTLDWYW
jgi:inositol oxygenase